MTGVTKSAVKVYVFDEHPQAREMIIQGLQQYPEIEVCGVSGTISELLFHIGSMEPDVILYEVKMANRKGIEAFKKIRAYTPTAKLIVATSYPDPTEKRQVLQLGADGYWNQQQGIDELYRLIITARTEESSL